MFGLAVRVLAREVAMMAEAREAEERVGAMGVQMVEVARAAAREAEERAVEREVVERAVATVVVTAAEATAVMVAAAEKEVEMAVEMVMAKAVAMVASPSEVG